MKTKSMTPSKRIQTAIGELETSMAILRDTIGRMVVKHGSIGRIKGLTDMRARYALLAEERTMLERIQRGR